MQGNSGSPSVKNRQGCGLFGSHTPAEVQIACYSRKQAFEYIRQSNFGRALAHLFVALKLIPSWRQELSSHFSQALSEGCKQLMRERRLDEIISLMKDGLQLYPKDEVIMMDLGSLFFKLDNIEEALKYYKEALKASPSLLPAHRAVQSIYNKEVERWHFRMLNDASRNEAYRQAIVNRIKEGHYSVLDVGTGAGLLSLFAAESGALEVHACESNSFMIKTAKSVLLANNVSERVHLIEKHSNLITIPSDIPNKVSLLVTEIFDAGLLGEGILPVLLHAWERLLLPPSQSNGKFSKGPSGVVVPYSAAIYISAIQCLHIARRHRLLPRFCSCCSAIDKLTIHEGKSQYHDVSGSKICKVCGEVAEEIPLCKDDVVFHLDDASVGLDLSEPYTTEDLENVPSGFELLSSPLKVMDINFNNLEELRAYSNASVKENLVPVPINAPGSVDAIALWFHLNLDDNGTAITSAPFEESGFSQGKCWHQAIYPSTCLNRVSVGDVLNICLDTTEGIIKIRDSGTLCPSTLFLVSDNIVAFLNNKTWVKAFQATAANLFESMIRNSSCGKKVLDLNPFPLLGLAILKRGDSSWKLTAKAKTNADKSYIYAVARANFINENQIHLVSDETLEQELEHNFDVICLDVVDSRGELVANLSNVISLLVDRLSDNGIMVPWSLSIEGQLIESQRLVAESRVVSDKSTGNFKISEIVNNFSVDYHLDIPHHEGQFRALSNQFELLKIYPKSLHLDQMCTDLTIVSTGCGRATGVIYWMNLTLFPGSDPISTRGYDSHCNQAVFFVSCDVEPGMDISLKCIFWYGMLDVKLLN